MKNWLQKGVGDTPLQIWQSLRPKQWTKNLFIFAGILFSQNVLNFPLLLKVIFAFLIFNFLSGSIYIFNDLVDLEQDKHHILKSQRPLASGRLKVSYAILSFILIALITLGMSYCLGMPFFLVALAYFLLQIIYSLSLKHIVILDVFTIACGFVLRVVAGTVVIGVEISSWLILCTILLSLLLGFSKRRHELIILEDGAKNHRKALAEYSPYLLDQMISVVTAGTVVAYALYTMSAETIEKFGTKNLIFTIPFVLYGIFRYLYLIHPRPSLMGGIHQKGAAGSEVAPLAPGSGNPENILVTDKPLIINIFLWVLAVWLVLYG